jgi:uncharacterized protein with PIN domain
VDSTCGRLVRWLRLLGFDAAYLAAEENPAALFRRARREGRLVLSRSSRVQRRSPDEVMLVRGDLLEEQLAGLLPRLSDRGARPQPLTRCPECNLEVRPLPRESAAGLVPPHVLRTSSAFARCPCCARVYWPATHTRDILDRLARLDG